MSLPHSSSCSYILGDWPANVGGVIKKSWQLQVEKVEWLLPESARRAKDCERASAWPASGRAGGAGKWRAVGSVWEESRAVFKSAGFKIPVEHQVSRQIKGERSTVPRELSLRTAVAYHPTRRRHAVSLVQSVTPESSQCERDCGPSVSEHTRTPPRTRGPSGLLLLWR